jgi:S-adenosylmethionine hydrolase
VAAKSDPIVFATDFGLGNEWVGMCHAVMSRIAPESPIVDLSHLIRPLNVTAGALLLADSLRYVAENAVIVSIVDPSVGKDRDIALETESGARLVGRTTACCRSRGRSSAASARRSRSPPTRFLLKPVSPSLHARDVLCPAAAHLAIGADLEFLGSAVEPFSLARLSVPDPEVQPGRIRCEVVDLNRFGNIQLNVRESHFHQAGLDHEADLGVESPAQSVHARYGRTYSDFEAGEYGVMFDPRGWLLIVRGNPASAFEGLGLQIGDQVWLSDPASMSERSRPRSRLRGQLAASSNGVPSSARAPRSRARARPSGAEPFDQGPGDGRLDGRDQVQPVRGEARCQEGHLDDQRVLSADRRNRSIISR